MTGDEDTDAEAEDDIDHILDIVGRVVLVALELGRSDCEARGEPLTDTDGE